MVEISGYTATQILREINLNTLAAVNFEFLVFSVV